MKTVIGSIIITLCCASVLLANIIRVPQDQPNIQAGITAAVKGDTVLVAAGTYYENINFKGKAITVASYYLMDGDTTHINNTIINGSKPSHADSSSVVYFISGEDTNSVLCGFTITKGSGTEISFSWEGTQYSERAGGGILCFEAGARIVSNKIIENSVYSADKTAYGGGLAAEALESSSTIILQNNWISNNTVTVDVGQAYAAGVILSRCKGILLNNRIEYNSVIHNATTNKALAAGIICYSETSDRREVIIEFNKINHNKVTTYSDQVANTAVGGGILIQGNEGRFVQNEVSNNEIWIKPGKNAVGGGIQIIQVADSFIIEGNIISENAVNHGNGWGGGIGLYGCSPYLINNIINGNSVTKGGGGLYTTTDVKAKLINNTIVNNTASEYGGGMIVRNSAALILMNNIIWNNQAPTGASIHIEEGTVQATYCDIQGGWTGTGNIDANPLFAFPDHQLSNSSPCIGAGIASLQIGGTTYNCPNSDIEGNPRPNPFGSKPDIGAYENPLGTPQGPILVPEQFASIQAGINAARDGDVVLVRDNTYYENINFKGKAITVASYFLMDGDTAHINNTIIDGSKPSHADSGSAVFFISGEDTTSVLCGFTITKGSGTMATFVLWGDPGSCRGGGGIFCYNSGARIVHNKIIENSINSPDNNAYGGGLVALSGGSTAWVILAENQITHNTLTANAATAARGGGVKLIGNGIILNNLISFNSIIQNASDGLQASSGGLECSSDTTDRRTVMVESNKINHNSVVNKSNRTDGVVACSGGVTIAGCYGRFANNEIGYNDLLVNSNTNAGGAGLLINYAPASFMIAGNIIRNNAVKQGNGLGGGVLIGAISSPMFINNIVEGNSATVGGGLIISRSTVQVINNTIINNQATSGGGINVRLNSTVYLMNNIVWGNQASTYAGIQREDATVKAAYCDIQSVWSGTGNFGSDPLFADALFHLSDKSPCIGKGIASFDFGDGKVCNCPPTDYDGNARPNPVDEFVDIGAFESEFLKPGTGIENKKDLIPDKFSLEQNYPNPFNPSTIIEFALPKSAFVTLKIYNLLGEEVATLIAEQRSAGIHKINWDARGLASGVYLYRLEAGDPSTRSGQIFVQSKKLILMR